MSSMKDADAAITMRNGMPCFYYPQDKEIRKRPYSFAYLDVSKAGPVGGGVWAIQIANPEKKGLLDPNSPETCIVYGVLNPGTENMEPPKPLLIDTPYEVFIRVSARSEGVHYERKYLSNFCLSRNEKGETVLVGAEVNKQIGGWQCLKPGETTKRSFWQKLFGD